MTEQNTNETAPEAVAVETSPVNEITEANTNETAPEAVAVETSPVNEITEANTNETAAEIKIGLERDVMQTPEIDFAPFIDREMEDLLFVIAGHFANAKVKPTAQLGEAIKTVSAAEVSSVLIIAAKNIPDTDETLYRICNSRGGLLKQMIIQNK